MTPWGYGRPTRTKFHVSNFQGQVPWLVKRKPSKLNANTIPRLNLHPNPGDIQMNFQILGGLPPPMQTPPKLPMGGCGGAWAAAAPDESEVHLNTTGLGVWAG